MISYDPERSRKYFCCSCNLCIAATRQVKRDEGCLLVHSHPSHKAIGHQSIVGWDKCGMEIYGNPELAAYPKYPKSPKSHHTSQLIHKSSSLHPKSDQVPTLGRCQLWLGRRLGEKVKFFLKQWLAIQYYDILRGYHLGYPLGI